MAAFLAELVAIPTENPPGTNDRACADLLEARTRQLHLDCERFQPAETSKVTDQEHPCLLTTFGSGERSLYFHGHYDVVPARSSNSSSRLAKTTSYLGVARAI